MSFDKQIRRIVQSSGRQPDASTTYLKHTWPTTAYAGGYPGYGYGHGE